jgi:hypothetical protein
VGKVLKVSVVPQDARALQVFRVFRAIRVI